MGKNTGGSIYGGFPFEIARLLPEQVKYNYANPPKSGIKSEGDNPSRSPSDDTSQTYKTVGKPTG